MKNSSEMHFLGGEFLLWLYWKSCEEGSVSLDNLGLGDISISFEEMITLDSITGDGYRESVMSQDISELQSVRDSIAKGRVPVSAKIRMIEKDLEWFFSLRSEPLKMSSVKLPSTAGGEDVAAISLRLESIVRLELVMKGLFNSFLIERGVEETPAELKDFLGIK